FLFCSACIAQTENFPKALRQEYEAIISLGGSPSLDTSGITFFKKNGWFIQYEMSNPMIQVSP
ncbi:MAG: hypothetical protein ABIS69_08500, partial [Sediminibacterium sp.]